MRTPVLLAALVIVGALATMTASAATMGVDTADAATGTGVIESCQDVAFVATPQAGDGNVNGVTITGIQPGCVGGTLQLVITNPGGTKLTGKTVGTITTSHLTTGIDVNLPPIPAVAAAKIHLVVVGP